ncbi:MAG TPA: HupE/UreJ family protein [Vicinamibacteria bacterium]|nr:HupE/UreJ family protein [Vicinamibacteria bacterium]
MRRDARKLSRLGVGAAALLVWLQPANASAHLVNTGFGRFYDGLYHLLLTPEDLVPVMGLALLAGLRGPRYGRWSLFVLTGAWLAGGLFGLQHATEASLPILTAVTLLILGALVAADRALPLPVVAGLGLALGLPHGYLNGTAMSQAGLSFTGLVGIGCAVFSIVALVSAFVVSLKVPWARIAVRVAGSWIAAVGMLLLGWTFRGGA